MKNKFIVGCLSIIAVFSMGCVNAAADFSDVPESHWANASIERWAEEKVILGYDDGTYKAENAITRAEFITMLDRIFALSQKADLSNFKDVDKDAWYYDSLAKAYKLGIIEGYSDVEMAPNKSITRQEAMTIIYRILKNDSSSVNSNVDQFTDSSDIATWAKDAISLMVENGYVNGYEDNTIKPNSNITRAETAQILNKTFKMTIRKPGTYNIDEIDGNVVVASDNVTIEGENSSGKIYIAPDVNKVEIKNRKSNIIELKYKEENASTKTTSSGSSKTSHDINVSITEDNGIYLFAQQGTSYRLTKDDTLTLEGIVNIENASLRTEAEVEAVIREIISQLEEEKILATAKKYKGNSTVQAKAIKVLGTESAGEFIENTAVATMVEKTLNALDRDDLLELANVVLK